MDADDLVYRHANEFCPLEVQLTPFPLVEATFAFICILFAYRFASIKANSFKSYRLYMCLLLRFSLEVVVTS